VKRDLERIEIPGEHDARVRSWEVVRAAFAEREPVRRRARLARPVLVLAVLAALAAAALSPPGEAVIDRLRDAIGVENAEEALFSLPTSGRLLVESADGPWIVQADGSKRRLGDYREASWSPFGRFVVAARRDELAALEPDGDVRWSLARPDVRAPRWGGTRTDTRIAYLSRAELRIVAGDGENDRRVARRSALVAPAWRPRSRHVLTYATPGGEVVTVDTERRRELWRAAATLPVEALAWSSDGRRLLVLRRGRVDVLTRDGAVWTGIRPEPGTVVAAAFRPGSHAIAYAVERGRRTQLALVAEGGGVLFSGAGSLDEVTWSPDGRWLLVAWREADQWVFVRAAGAPRIVAVASISAQFGGSFPRVAGWCCPR
jgi:hypothetical protein